MLFFKQKEKWEVWKLVMAKEDKHYQEQDKVSSGRYSSLILCQKVYLLLLNGYQFIYWCIYYK